MEEQKFPFFWFGWAFFSNKVHRNLEKGIVLQAKYWKVVVDGIYKVINWSNLIGNQSNDLKIAFPFIFMREIRKIQESGIENFPRNPPNLTGFIFHLSHFNALSEYIFYPMKFFQPAVKSPHLDRRRLIHSIPCLCQYGVCSGCGRYRRDFRSSCFAESPQLTFRGFWII